ncbi:hypothetical protein DICPUDRAFT_159113 [Dictyostelium purpureum]|uniref:Uncharacterized protein n=1 Tax=Dictyostelium purpureum TaxID=5786 RepID=F1A3B6_DICPU|nr:uncharacterized protein DICPUDRAFT_159113 [Dictyostelium purpureum]EGC29315.1 hypothetical protein DICPUDRAFT_159113 [Dictyostelium purpureum]|eukprot:XP_003294163.1 hypothetical protein DICPUDRAFT_159113 [Dictyostelium purpureum]
MKYKVLFFFIIIIFLNQVSTVFCKLPKEQCNSFKKLNKKFNKLSVINDGLEETTTYQKLKINSLMFNTLYRKYCSKHPDEPLLEEMEGNDCLILKKIIEDFLIEQKEIENTKKSFTDNYVKVNNENYKKITYNVKHYYKEIKNFEHALLEFSQEVCNI